MDKLSADLEIVKNIASFLKQDRNANHLSDSDIEKAKQAVDSIQKRIKRYEKT